MARLDESGMASAVALAAVSLLLIGAAALLQLSGHNRLAAREAVQTARLLEASRSAVQRAAAQLEQEDQRRRLQAAHEPIEVLIDCTPGNAVWYRVTGSCIPAREVKENAGKEPTYRLEAVSWQSSEEKSSLQETAEPSGRCAHAATIYIYREGRLLYLRWEK